MLSASLLLVVATQSPSRAAAKLPLKIPRTPRGNLNGNIAAAREGGCVATTRSKEASTEAEYRRGEVEV
jgi:hypothetical protein